MLGWFSDIRKDPWRLGRHGFALLAMLMAGAFLWIVQWRIVTYVCGNDPMLYIRAARTLLRPEFYGAEAVRHALTFVAPGYPVFLAAAIWLFGSLSPYWINAAVLTAALPLTWEVFRRLMGSDRAAAFALLGWLWIVFSGHPLHAPFLLYPFRETPRLFLVMAAYVLLLAGTKSDKPRGLVLMLSSFSLLLACAIREPSALVLPGLLLGAAGLADSWRKRGVVWGWLLAPWLLAGAGVLAALLYFKPLQFSQFSVVRYLGNHDVALARMGKMLPWFVERGGGWAGLLFIFLGVVRAGWKSRALLGLFLVPAALFFGFCAYMQMHDRYFLTALLFLVPFAGYGLDALCAGADKVFRSSGAFRGFDKPASDVFAGGLFLLLAIGLLRTSTSLSPWGPQVHASEVRQWQRLVSGLEPSADGRVRIAVEQRTRYLEDMVMSYTDAELLDPKEIEDWPSGWAPTHYFRPLNHKALWATPQWLMYLKLYAHRLMEYRLNEVPVDEASGAVHAIGAGRYALHRISDWRTGVHEQVVEVEPGVDQTFWLDWGAADPALAKEIRLADAASGEIWLQVQTNGNGLVAVFLAGEQVCSGRAKLTVSCAGPLPDRPVVAVARGGEGPVFDLGRERRMSANHWFPDRKPDDDEVYCPRISSERVLRLKLPPLISQPAAKWEVVCRGTWKGADSAWRLEASKEGENVAYIGQLAEAGAIKLEGQPGEVLSLRWVPIRESDRTFEADMTSVEWKIQPLTAASPSDGDTFREYPDEVDSPTSGAE